eukprot:COSAG01_NODE_422_length_17262_cov_42.635903_19_plen_68_part_00
MPARTACTAGALVPYYFCASAVSAIEAQTPEEWRIIGSEGMMVFDAPAHAPLELRVIKPVSTHRGTS